MVRHYILSSSMSDFEQAAQTAIESRGIDGVRWGVDAGVHEIRSDSNTRGQDSLRRPARASGAAYRCRFADVVPEESVNTEAPNPVYQVARHASTHETGGKISGRLADCYDPAPYRPCFDVRPRLLELNIRIYIAWNPYIFKSTLYHEYC